MNDTLLYYYNNSLKVNEIMKCIYFKNSNQIPTKGVC